MASQVEGERDTGNFHYTINFSHLEYVLSHFDLELVISDDLSLEFTRSFRFTY